MEEMMDFDEWISTQQTLPTGFCAVYDPETGMIKSIRPVRSAMDETFKVDVTDEFAESIFSGSVNPGLFFVDPETSTVESLENQSLVKVDQLILRVPVRKFTEVGDFNVCITYDRINKKLIFELSKKFGGTFWDDRVPLTKKVVFWDASTTLSFLLCNYNDPNIIHEIISFTLSDLIGMPKVFENINLPERFSVYHSNRILKNYVVDEI